MGGWEQNIGAITISGTRAIFLSLLQAPHCQTTPCLRHECLNHVPVLQTYISRGLVLIQLQWGVTEGGCMRNGGWAAQGLQSALSPTHYLPIKFKLGVLNAHLRVELHEEGRGL